MPCRRLKVWKQLTKMYKKILFWLILAGILFLVPITVLHNTPLSIALKYHASTTNFLQRLLGLAIYILLFSQILITEYIEKLKKWLGSSIYNFSIWQGILICILVLIHPLMFLLYRHFNGNGTDPFFIFTDVCGFCQTKMDFYYTLGRFAFWIFSVGIIAWIFKSSIPFLKKDWKSFNVISFVVFLLSGIHGFLTGMDFTTKPFYYFAIISYLVVLYIVVRKLPHLIASYKNWLKS